MTCTWMKKNVRTGSLWILRIGVPVNIITHFNAEFYSRTVLMCVNTIHMSKCVMRSICAECKTFSFNSQRFFFCFFSFLVGQLREASNRRKRNHLMEEKKKKKQEEKTDFAQKKVKVKMRRRLTQDTDSIEIVQICCALARAYVGARLWLVSRFVFRKPSVNQHQSTVAVCILL